MLCCLQGSIEQAVAQVEAFRGSLEHRVVARFDDAVSAGDLGSMSECARIMAEFRQGESQLVQVLRALLLESASSCTLMEFYTSSNRFYRFSFPALML